RRSAAGAPVGCRMHEGSGVGQRRSPARDRGGVGLPGRWPGVNKLKVFFPLRREGGATTADWLGRERRQPARRANVRMARAGERAQRRWLLSLPDRHPPALTRRPASCRRGCALMLPRFGIPTKRAHMSIKSDNWIRRMAEQHGMIEPFEPGQVKHNDGGRIVSYGTSSYGYDVRCAGEFKIFTNINSTIVDPKDFDSRNFVDFSGDCCLIPPNSFALARTVEYFRI